MKIIKSEGCTTAGIEVDGKDLEDFSIEEKESLLNKLIEANKAYGVDVMISILLDNLEYEYQDCGYCEQCGDNSYKQTYEIE